MVDVGSRMNESSSESMVVDRLSLFVDPSIHLFNHEKITTITICANSISSSFLEQLVLILSAVRLCCQLQVLCPNWQNLL
mmetsp:Transcript_32018/g.47278  ORF Transcript_32018/g.47278 Transcript_32018/m.47278 type:complete len:80 (-) Transcript_32018:327-566(-)